MAGLFDAIRGAMMVMGGYGDTRREEVKSQSEADYRKGVIEQGERKIKSEEDLAKAQRDLSERLQEKAFGQQKEMQATEIDYKKAEAKDLREFQGSQNQLVRDNAVQLAHLHIQAQKDVAQMNNMTQWEINNKDIEFKKQALEIDKALRERGLTIQEGLAKGTVTHQNAQVLLEAIKLAYPQGLEALYSSVIAPEQKAKIQAEGNAKFKAIMEAVDPDNKLGVKSLVVTDIVKPVSPQPTYPQPSPGAGFTPPPGVSVPISGVSSGSPFSGTRPPYNSPALGGLSFSPNAPPSPPTSGIPAYRQATSFGTEPLNAALDPQDQFRLKNIAAFALQQPDPQAALAKGLEFIQSPEASFAGHAKITDPRQRDFYNKAAGFELQNMFNEMKGQ